MILGHWILDNDGNIVEATLNEWANWVESGKQRVAETIVGEARISTVFLGLDHNFSSIPKEPVLWETMVFGGKFDQHQERCSGKLEDAKSMHNQVVALVERSDV